MRAIYVIESNDNGHWASVCEQESADWHEGVFATRKEADVNLKAWRKAMPIEFRIVKYVREQTA